MRPLAGHLRAVEGRLLTGRCAVTRPGEGDGPLDPDTGQVADPPPVQVFEGACLVRPTDRASRIVESGGRALSLLTYDVTLPAGTPVERGDTLTVTASADPGLVGQALTVLDVPYDEAAVSRRIVCEDRQ